ncbi:type II toxin-antitoxin system RelE family toxin [Geminocystis sp. CENA526]|uniref:type II toxin-antitoxin system RelE family toxin n=1 Tax=Geminocystis sp. CENA526 TaxID=1355871 RepID=UPI003D6FFDF6
MNYNINIKKRASKVLESLSNVDYQRVRDAIRELAKTPRPSGCLKLTGRNAWRIRVGVYRIIYTINDSQLTIVVIDIGHRRDIYR